MLPPYVNEALTDFSRAEAQEAFAAALERVKREIGKTYPLIINGEPVGLSKTSPSINPSRPAEVLGNFADGTAQHVDQAIAAAAEAFETWQHVPVEERARYLLRAAGEMRRRKHEFSAIMVLEAGKSWSEADADTSEAIDFLEYYARQAMRVFDSSGLLAPYPNEETALYYIPLGVGAVIPPWNFPNAIVTGMVGACLATGNTVVVKPAEQTPWIAYRMCQLFWDQGIPPGVLNYLTGDGAVVGGRMVEHPQTRFITFTGSKAVGVGIYEQAAKIVSGQ
jgi:1-pyrroline-5-carboxylate dehydrogenase